VTDGRPCPEEERLGTGPRLANGWPEWLEPVTPEQVGGHGGDRGAASIGPAIAAEASVDYMVGTV